MSLVMESEYKGLPTLMLKNNAEETFPFQFGVRKAKLVLAHIEDIRTFVKKYDRTH
jgi:hypothetical protein